MERKVASGGRPIVVERGLAHQPGFAERLGEVHRLFQRGQRPFRHVGVGVRLAERQQQVVASAFVRLVLEVEGLEGQLVMRGGLLNSS